jgi:hypothetical protein
MRRKPALICGAAALAILLSSGCSGKAPEISRIYSGPILVHDLGNNRYLTKLVVYAVASDPDGMDDLDALYVIDDDAELYWSIESKSWTSATAEGETWIGTDGVSMPGGVGFPAGTYRVLLEDQGGYTAEDSFTLSEDTSDPAKATYPTVTVTDDAVKVSGGPPNAEIWVYSKDGKLAMRLSASGTPISGPPGPASGNAAPPGGAAGQTPGQPLTLAAIAAGNAALGAGFTFWVYAYNERGGYGLLVGPFTSGPQGS